MSRARAERYEQAAERLRAMVEECASWCDTPPDARPTDLSLIDAMTGADGDRYRTMLGKMRSFADRLDGRSRTEANGTLRDAVGHLPLRSAPPGSAAMARIRDEPLAGLDT